MTSATPVWDLALWAAFWEGETPEEDEFLFEWIRANDPVLDGILARSGS